VFAEVDGKPVKYVARDRKKGEKHGGGRPRVYTADFTAVLVNVWDAFGSRDCRNFMADLRGMMDFLVADGGWGITPDIREKLLKISGSHANRLVAQAKKKADIFGVSTTKSAQMSLRSQVPVCTYHDRAEAKPGTFASDTVAHCGYEASGHFCKSLSWRDFYSGWLELRPLLNAAKEWVKRASEDIKAGLPFPVLGVHNDNGGEFINRMFIDWCISQCIKQTRSRPNEKNDNALAEQTNGDAVRKYVGYFRFIGQEDCDGLEAVYRPLCLLYNYWFHSAKLIGREVLPNGKHRKIYEKQVKTPFERLMESPDVSEESKAELRRRKAEQNPVELNRELNDAIDRLLRKHFEKCRMEEASEKAAEQACAA
jgi:hypothetical protein